MRSLRDIEKSLALLWMNEDARSWIESGASSDSRPNSANELDLDLLPHLDQKGINLYGRLMNYGHHDVMDSVYPYCRKLFAKDWNRIVDDYLTKFPPAHPNFNRLCQAFPCYVSTYGGSHAELYPFLSELADYEWIELEKMEDPAKISVLQKISIEGPEQVESFGPLLNPTLSLRRYKFPITEIVSVLERGKRPSKKLNSLLKEPCFLAIYRDPNSHQTKFLELGSAAASIVESASKAKPSYQDLLKIAIAETPEIGAQNAAVQFLELVDQLQVANVIVGSQRVRK